MRILLISLLFTTLSTLSVQAQSSSLESLDSLDGARGWEAVGRIDIVGKGFCTGALIAPDLVLTAAHCMFDEGSNGEPVDPSRIEFLAGLRGGRPEATRSIRNAVIHPSYISTDEASAESVRYDVALLQLDRPIRSSRVIPFEVSTSARHGTAVGVVSYAQDREEAPSLQERCNVIGENSGVLYMDCAVNFGASGSPVFRDENGVQRLVSVVSAMADVDGETLALGMDLAAPIAALRLALQEEQTAFPTTSSSVRIIRNGERNDTGALFVRP